MTAGGVAAGAGAPGDGARPGGVFLGASSLAIAELASGLVAARSPGAGGAAAGCRAAGMGAGVDAAICGARSLVGGVATAAATPAGAAPVGPTGAAAFATPSLGGMGLTATCSAGGRIMNQPTPAIAIRKTRAIPRRAQGARRAGRVVSGAPGAVSRSTPSEIARLETCGATSGVLCSSAAGAPPGVA